MSLRKTSLRIHRWVSLAAAAFWLIQCTTGMLLVFHWELDDATVSGPTTPVDFAAIERRVLALAPPGSGTAVSSIWTSAGAPNRFDISLDGSAPDASRTVRIDGIGNVLRSRVDGENFADGGIFTTLVLIHQKLFAGDTGSWIVGISGCLLLSNIVLGLTLAWPRRGTWRKAVTPPSRGGPAARWYGWHRALGLWAGVPAAFLVSAGVMLVFEAGVSELVAAPPIEAEAPPALPARVGIAEAVTTALARHPGSTFSGVAGFPDEENGVYRVRVLKPGELRRAYGTTTVFVSAHDGSVVADFDALEAAPSRRFMDNLFPFHTGEMGGTLGRIFVFAIGLWLATMIILGVALWQARRPNRASSRRKA